MRKARPFAKPAHQRPAGTVASDSNTAWARALRSPLPALRYPTLFIIALLPRVTGLADFITTDEAYHWVERVANFGDALVAHRWAQTIQTGHPGVTTMWLGVVGQWLEMLFRPFGDLDYLPLLGHLAWLRLPHALLEALAVPLAYALLRRLVSPLAAALAALLWATSPFLIAHGRLLHLDGLLATFVTLSVLLLMQRREQAALHVGSQGATPGLSGPAGRSALSRRPLVFTILSGACAGLALLTKGPALILLPFAGLLMLAQATGSSQRPAAGGRLALAVRPVGSALSVYCIWLGSALLVVVLLWPALWVAPGAALERYVGEIVSNGGRANGDGQFFLGQAVQDPGPLFYPVANLLRTTPAMLLGLIFYFGFWIVDWRLNARQRATQHQVALLAFVLFWTALMTIGPKKFDRYVLPTWPALLALAALGWAALLEQARAGGPLRGRLVAGALCLALGCEGAQLAWYHPYYLSYYNPLLGGGATAQRALLIGWGEGMDAVGAALRARPDIADGPVLSALGATLQPFLPVPVKDVEEYGRDPANYVVVYLESVQRAANPGLYAQLGATLPIQRIAIHGIDYATIHQLPRPFARPVDATFGGALRLAGVTVRYAEGQATVTPAWDVRGQPAADYTLFVHVLDERGARVAGADVPPGGDGSPTSAWRPGEQRALPVSFAANLAPGSYRVVLGLYDAGGARAAVSGGTLADATVAGPNAVLVDTLAVP